MFQCCRNDHEQNGRNLHDIGRWWEDYTRYKVHRFSYQIYDLLGAKDSSDIFDRRRVQVDFPYYTISI